MNARYGFGIGLVTVLLSGVAMAGKPATSAEAAAAAAQASLDGDMPEVIVVGNLAALVTPVSTALPVPPAAERGGEAKEAVKAALETKQALKLTF